MAWIIIMLHFVRLMKKSDLILKAVDALPRTADLFMRTVARYMPSHWLLSHIASDRNLRIPITTRLFNGTTIEVILGDGISDAIRRHGCYEPASVRVVISQLDIKSVFFDVGAHVGQYTLLAAPVCRWVHSFEAVPDTFALLRENVYSNALYNVKIENVAVSDRCGRTTIYEGPAENLGTSSLTPLADGNRAFSVRAISIDDYCATENTLPDVIKIDVEGAEILVLRGAEQVIRAKHPTMLVEISDVNQRRFGFSEDDLIRELKAFGYCLSRIDDQNSSSGRPEFYNVLANMAVGDRPPANYGTF
jgi:FkbM family methyltransferase